MTASVIMPTDEQIVGRMDTLAGVTFVVAVRGGKLVLRPNEPNPLVVAHLANQSVTWWSRDAKNRDSKRCDHRAVLITATYPGGIAEDSLTTDRRYVEMTRVLADADYDWIPARSFPGCGDRPWEDHAFVYGMSAVAANDYARRWEQVCYLDIDLEERPDGTPRLVFTGSP